MKKLALVGVSLLGGSAAFWLLGQKTVKRAAEGASEGTILYYRDPMHP